MSNTPTRLTKDKVLNVAKLANLTLKNTEIEKLTGELSLILSYVGKLNELDTSDVTPTNQITGLINVTREDTVREETVLPPKDALANAPHKKGDFFEVEAVFTND